MLDISVIILTKNEALHIERCVRNAQRFAKDIYVVDSFSTDETIRVAEKLGAKIYQNPWTYHAKQFNWALENLPIQTAWVLRLDADEYLSDELIAEIQALDTNQMPQVTGFAFPRYAYFIERLIRRGVPPLVLLRLFRYKIGYVEDRQMDEHVLLKEGVAKTLKAPFYDHNLYDLTCWTDKHNHYATREAKDLLMMEYLPDEIGQQMNSNENSVATRQKKLKYLKLPLFFRAFLFFVYRYIFLLGFLEGKEGFLRHFLQCFWYRTLADAKVYEIKKRFNFDADEIRKWLKSELHK